MDLQQLRDIGGLVSQTPVTKEITWTPPDKDGVAQEPVIFTVRVKKLSFGMVERMWAVDIEDRSNMATVVSASILLGTEGEERFSYEDAFQLEPGLARSLMTAIGEVNGTGAAAAKN